MAPAAPEDLTGYSCVNLRLPTRDELLSWEFRKGRRRIDVKVRGQLVFNNSYQMLDAALQGFGLAYLPKALVEPHARSGHLRWVLEAASPLSPVITPTTRRESSLPSPCEWPSTRCERAAEAQNINQSTISTIACVTPASLETTSSGQVQRL
jgi:DNA-binding transcriptional LysR family regulator